MHELSIAMSILDILESACRDKGYSRVEAVRGKVGKATCVMKDSLLFSFDCSKKGTVAEGARLEIDEIPLGVSCRDCHSESAVDEAYVLACPRCGGKSFQVTSGHELEISELEVES